MQIPPSSELNVRRVTRRDEDEESLRSSVVCEDGSSETTPRDRCSVILRRSEYYTIPPLHELNQSIDSNGDVFVDDFVVGREGYGQVKFYGRTNVAGLNLDEIVFFRRREIEVYPDTYPNKPPVGEKLNKKAEITLEKVWPNDKTSHKPITSPERLKLQGWQKRVEAATAKLGAMFLEYNLDNGNWVFTVEHFTRYGMHQYLDDEQLAKKLKRPPIKPQLQDDGNSVEKEKLEILRHLQEKKQQLEAYEKEKQRAALSLHDQEQ
ncbi:Nuclear pore complex protein Nup98-Nup96 [Desmophyllum pertusum]|uniref:Nuclear pore complex protein Nup98-Nup96 n=1 Tax=Desmophyllum pertusum TaxID=174260 RepID=A0A9W9ZVA2_9CNID|nr:Nuclear pore complex protein Nup98-Nup96 [Desmophyllum pertusum]